MTAIEDLDGWLRELVDGLPETPRRYELYCHPDVIEAIRRAADPPDYFPSWPLAAGAAARWGTADVIALPELGPGRWELYEGGELVKSGRLMGSLTWFEDAPGRER
jgi:hypothetical protein